jgi:hypothetical protein
VAVSAIAFAANAECYQLPDGNRSTITLGKSARTRPGQEVGELPDSRNISQGKSPSDTWALGCHPA